MGMSTHICGFRPPDEQYTRMVDVWVACKAAGLEIPKDVGQFFGGMDPDDAGMEVRIDEAVEQWGDDSRSGLQVDLAKLPSGLRYVRFYNAW